MHDAAVHQCQCSRCSAEEFHVDQKHHHRINVLASRLNEQQRRWFVALESLKIGHGGDLEMSRITGLHVDTIRRGREELANDLAGRPVERVRLPGGGRPPLKKTTRRWCPTS